VLWLGRLFGSDPSFKLISVQLFMVFASLIPVGVAYRWGERLDSLRGGLIVGGFVAVWVDLLYIAAHPLSDVIAGDVLMAGLYAALPLTTRPSIRRLTLAGALFGLTFALRMQLGPALLVAAFFACGRSLRAWSALILGGALVLLASGSLDWITLGTPFQSIWLNVWLNIVKGVSSDYGTLPAAYYFIAPILFWGFPLSVLIVCQFVIGSRRFPALFAVVITIFLIQSIIPHKEWRFIFPALPPLFTLCGIAVIQEIRDIGGRRKSPSPSNVFAVAAVAIWIFASFAVALAPSYRPKWTLRSELIDAFALAAHQPGLCAVDLANILWIETSGSAALPPGIPIYANRSADVSRDWAGYNVAVSDVIAALPRDRFRRLGCFSGSMDVNGVYQKTACVWRRNGGCTPGVAKIPATNWPPFFTNAQGKPRLDRIQSYLPGRS
jgi:phosphatidylinositol glycan class B